MHLRSWCSPRRQRETDHVALSRIMSQTEQAAHCINNHHNDAAGRPHEAMGSHSHWGFQTDVAHVVNTHMQLLHDSNKGNHSSGNKVAARMHMHLNNLMHTCMASLWPHHFEAKAIDHQLITKS